MTTHWMQQPETLLGEPGKPYTVRNRRLPELQAYLTQNQMTLVGVDAADARSEADFISLLKEILVFPSWAGSTWDIFSDIGDEMEEEWPFPLALIVDNYSKMLSRNPELALSILWQLTSLSEGSRTEQRQFEIYFVL